MSNMGRAVTGVSRSKIRELVKIVRVGTGVAARRNFCVVDWLENVVCPAIGFNVDVREIGEMDDHALTDHNNKMIYIREDVYSGAKSGKGRDRMTLVHEVGHSMLHTPDRIVYARSFNVSVPAYRDPEWQAKAFAGELLIPLDLLEVGMSIDSICKEFGVSEDAAKIQLGVYQKENLLKFNGPNCEFGPSKITWMK